MAGKPKIKPAVIRILAAFFLLAVYAGECRAMDFNVGGLRLKKNVENIRQIRGKRVVRQSMDYSCGPAGVATILNYFLDSTISEQEIIDSMLKNTNLKKVIERKGFSLLDLKKFLQERGFKATGYKMDVEFLRTLQSPALVPIKFKNYRHFIVIKGIIKDRVFIADPTQGNTTMRLNKFMNIWQDGIGLVIENNVPRDPFKSCLSGSSNIGVEDAAIVDYMSINRLLERTAVRTAVFPSEF
jgi:predicted double-glycine peptidase